MIEDDVIAQLQRIAASFWLNDRALNWVPSQGTIRSEVGEPVSASEGVIGSVWIQPDDECVHYVDMERNERRIPIARMLV